MELQGKRVAILVEANYEDLGGQRAQLGPGLCGMPGSSL